MKRKIWFWLSFVVAIILGIYFATRIIMNTMGHGPAAVIRHISIDADTRDVDLSTIAAGAGVIPGTKARTIDLDAMCARIAAIPGVRDAAVRRMPNGSLRIRVTMYHAVALWSDGMAYYPLSADGTIVKTPSDTRADGAVVFVGAVPTDISDITAAAQNLGADLDYLQWIENRRWDIYTTRGIRIMLPEENPTAAIGTLASLNRTHGILGKNLKTIDLRDEARIIVK